MYLQNNPWHWIRYQYELLYEIRTVVSCRRKTTTFNWSSVAFTNMTGVACVARVQWWCVYCLTTLVLDRCWLVLSFLPPLSFLWGNNEQHTRIRNSSPIHTCTVAHPHALFYNTRWEKERRETSLTKCTAVCTGEKLCARMIILQQEKCYTTMHSFIQFHWWGYVH